MLKDWVWLAQRKGLSAQTRLALLSRFGTAENIYCADPEELLLTEDMDAQQLETLTDRDASEADRILEACQRLGVRIITIADGAYPERLKNLYDPPILLYCRGELPLLDERLAVAVVGTRDCTPYGERCAEKLGYGLSRGGATVVTGLAKGIDAAAARGALRAGGKPVGVLGNGVDVCYPRENAYLYDDLAAAGALLSEYPPGTEPAAPHFPARNRILAGLCAATLVVEAPEKSGALITAASALEQGRDVFAVPGPVDAPKSAGCNALIRNGAVLVSEAEDLLREYEGRYPLALAPREEPKALGYGAEQTQEATPVLPLIDVRAPGAELTDDQISVLRVLSDTEPTLPDDLAEATGVPIRRLLSALTVLEIDGHVQQHAGKRYTRRVRIK